MDLMNPTFKLLRAIGSPFVSESECPQNRREAVELYSHALKNKIGLLYLEALSREGKLGKLRLDYEKQHVIASEIISTVVRACRVLNLEGIDYTVFKTLKAYPDTPHDIDILLFGSNKEFCRARDAMLKANYKATKPGCNQLMVFDPRGGNSTNPDEGITIYGVDLYKEVAASHIIYLDKRKLSRYRAETELDGEKIKVLAPEAELTTIIIHSLIPEQLYTLATYYTTLFPIAEMKTKAVHRFIDIVKENNITSVARLNLALASALHEAAHGFIPEKLSEVSANLVGKTKETKTLAQSDFKMPYCYSWSTIIRTLLEKSKERRFTRSVARQAVSMLNPRLAKYVLSEIVDRRRRETY